VLRFAALIVAFLEFNLRAKTARKVYCTYIGPAYNLRPEAGLVDRSFRKLASKDKAGRI